MKDKLKMNIQTNKIILLVGLMGSGKTSVGKRLAQKLGLPFVDGDQEIEKAAGLSLIDVLKCFGEEEYRAGEARVMKRLLCGEPCVLASGGGSFVCEQTRKQAKNGKKPAILCKNRRKTIVDKIFSARYNVYRMERNGKRGIP